MNRLFFACFLGGWAVCHGAEMPFVAGDFSVAYTLLNEKAHVQIVGDSIQTGLINHYPQHWNIQNWSGYTAGPNLTVTHNSGNIGVFDFDFGFLNHPFMKSSWTVYSDNPASLAQGAYAGQTKEIVFTAQPAPHTGNHILANRIYSVTMVGKTDPPAYKNGYDWISKANGTIFADLLYYANPAGLASGVEIVVRNPDGTTGLRLPVNANAGTPQWKKLSFSFPTMEWPGNGSLAFEIRMLDGTVPAENSNFITAGIHFRTDVPGFNYTSMARGGKNLNYFLDQNVFTDDALSTTLQASDTNIAYVWLGTNGNLRDINGNIDDSQANYEARTRQLIDRYRAAKPDMKFILVAPFEAGSNDPRLAGVARALYNVATSEQGVMFMNMFEAAGQWAFLNSKYLSDGVHPNEAGIAYFADLTSQLLNLAAAPLPGDADRSGVVDALDFATLHENFNSPGGFEDGDFDGDGYVDFADFQILERAFGQRSLNLEAPGVQAMVVPEPALIMLLPLMLLGLRARAARRGKPEQCQNA